MGLSGVQRNKAASELRDGIAMSHREEGALVRRPSEGVEAWLDTASYEETAARIAGAKRRPRPVEELSEKHARGPTSLKGQAQGASLARV